MKALRLTGNFSVLFGSLATLSCMMPSTLFMGMLCAIIGFIFSIFSIFIYTKNELGKKSFTRAHLGMILSSIPVLYVLLIIFLHQD